jgi:hypothetical protein
LCAFAIPAHRLPLIKTFKLLKPAQNPRGESLEVSNVFISNGASGILYKLRLRKL